MRLKIVGVGDSTTAGTPQFLSPLEASPNGEGNVQSQYACWMMKAHPEWTVLNRGINGQLSDQILERFHRDIASEAPNYVIILAGVNDICQGISIESIKRNLLEMYEDAARAGIIPVAATILPYNSASNIEASNIRELNDWIRRTAKNRGIPFCDTNAEVARPENPDCLRASPDGQHPDISGYRSMGIRFAEVIRKHAPTLNQKSQ